MNTRYWVGAAAAVVLLGVLIAALAPRVRTGSRSQAVGQAESASPAGEPRKSNLLSDAFQRTGADEPDYSAQSGQLEFQKDIAPIINSKCALCHHQGGSAPFSLTSYGDVKRRAKRVRDAVHRRLMPPWKADRGFVQFEGDFSLTTQERATIEQWIAQGLPEGSQAQVAAAPRARSEWAGGRPDAVLEPAEPYAIAADGEDVYRCFVIPTAYAEDRYVRLATISPGEPSVVHHALLFADTSGAGRARDAADPGFGFTAFGALGFDVVSQLGVYAPGMNSRGLPDGTGYFLPKGADIIVQIHYHPTGKAALDRSKIGLYFCNGPVDKRVRVLPVAVPPRVLHLPAGDSDATFWAEQSIPGDCHLVGIFPHMHFLGREIAAAAYLPDGQKQPLVRISDWDFRWQGYYQPVIPVAIPRGTRLKIEAKYDNSSANARNPNHPPMPVHYGLNTTDEMCVVWFMYTVDAEKLTANVPAPAEYPDSFLRIKGQRFVGGRK